jgi:hypothetical protein
MRGSRAAIHKAAFAIDANVGNATAFAEGMIATEVDLSAFRIVL